MKEEDSNQSENNLQKKQINYVDEVQMVYLIYKLGEDFSLLSGTHQLQLSSALLELLVWALGKLV